MRTRVKNQLDSMAKNEGLSKGMGTRRGRQQFEAVQLAGWDDRRRKDPYALLDNLDQQIGPLDLAATTFFSRDLMIGDRPLGIALRLSIGSSQLISSRQTAWIAPQPRQRKGSIMTLGRLLDSGA
jgi:hypothetical protein